MKRTILYTIKLYQFTASPLLAVLFPNTGCRQWPTCSTYTYRAVKRHGALGGLRMGIVRLLKCNPWS